MTFQEISTRAKPILLAHSVEYAAIFGSAARGETRKESDIDILIRYSETPTLLEHIGLAQVLEDTLNTKVDLVTEGALNKSLIPFIKMDLKTLYGQTQRQDLY